MSIKSIRIKNLLSFDELIIGSFKDINCIVGKNNTGKSNLLKLIRYFYNKLDGKRELPPTLNSKYTAYGTITITYDTSRIKSIVTSDSNKNKSYFFQHIYNVLFKENDFADVSYLSIDNFKKKSTFDLTLQVNFDDSTIWSTKDNQVLNIINYLYPFFDVEARDINLHDWDKLWLIVSRLKSFNIDSLNQIDIVDFFDKNISDSSGAYKEYIDKIQEITSTSKYTYREKVLNYVKAGLKGHTFLINNKSLNTQSDGTNSHRYIDIALELLISLSRRDYISPIIYIDEPEIGLHPKKNEDLIKKLFNVYNSYKKTDKKREIGKYNTPYPKIIFATHSPNILKEVIRLFEKNQQVLHFSANKKNDNTVIKNINSIYQNTKFLNIFSDNEARLFFSTFILFVEGETELEIFKNKKLLNKFSELSKIDVYKSSSNIIGASVNPYNLNATIPYLFLFDADKIYSFQQDNHNHDVKKIKLENKNKALYYLPDGTKENQPHFNKLISKYKKGFNKKYNDILENLTNINDINKKEFTFNKVSFKINETDIYTEYLKYLKKYLSKNNVSFIHTTIEEVLINKNSEPIFFKWLENKFQFSIEDFLYDKREVEYSYSKYKHRIAHGKLILLTPRDIIKKKITYKKLKYNKLLLEVMIDYIRVQYFDGKFELLNNTIVNNSNTHNKKEKNKFNNMKTSIYSKIEEFYLTRKVSEKEKVHFEKIFNRYLDTSVNIDSTSTELYNIMKIFPIKKQHKTDGWATSFLDFAIVYIEKTRGNNEFENEFKKYFKELYDIIVSIKSKV